MHNPSFRWSCDQLWPISLLISWSAVTYLIVDLMTCCDLSQCWSRDLLWPISLLISWPAATYLMESSLLPDSAGVDSSSAAGDSGSGGEGCPGGGKITSFSFTRSCKHWMIHQLHWHQKNLVNHGNYIWDSKSCSQPHTTSVFFMRSCYIVWYFSYFDTHTKILSWVTAVIILDTKSGSQPHRSKHN